MSLAKKNARFKNSSNTNAKDDRCSRDSVRSSRWADGVVDGKDVCAVGSMEGAGDEGGVGGSISDSGSCVKSL